MDVKADHRAAGLSIHLNFLDVQGVDGEDIAVGFALRRRRAAVACLTKIGLSSDWSLQPDSMKAESLVIADQQRRGECVPGPCTHRPSSHESG